MIGEIVLSLKGVSKSFKRSDSGAFDVLHKVSLDLRAGEIVGICGPSGCGKTTLLNVASNFIPADAGSVQIASGHRLYYIFQEDSLLPWKTVEQNVALAQKLRRESDDFESAPSVLQQVGIAKHKAHYPSQLSGGLKRRASLAVALASRASLVLADEPMGALDEPARLELVLLMRQVAKQHAWSMVYVSHNLDELALVSDRIVIMGFQKQGFVHTEDCPAKDPRSCELLIGNGEMGRLVEKLRQIIRKDVEWVKQPFPI